jgi:hypothetical protein
MGMWFVGHRILDKEEQMKNKRKKDQLLEKDVRGERIEFFFFYIF